MPDSIRHPGLWKFPDSSSPTLSENNQTLSIIVANLNDKKYTQAVNRASLPVLCDAEQNVYLNVEGCIHESSGEMRCTTKNGKLVVVEQCFRMFCTKQMRRLLPFAT